MCFVEHHLIPSWVKMKPPHHLWQYLYQFWLVQSQLTQAMLWNTPGVFFQLLLRTEIQNVFQDTDKNCIVKNKYDIILLLLSLIYLPSSVSLSFSSVSLYLYLCLLSLPPKSFLIPSSPYPLSSISTCFYIPWPPSLIVHIHLSPSRHPSPSPSPSPSLFTSNYLSSSISTCLLYHYVVQY